MKGLGLGLLLWCCSLLVQAETASFAWQQLLPTSAANHFRITTPPGFRHNGEPMPLLIFLHGAGEQGDDRVLNRGLPIIERQLRRFPMLVVSTQLPINEAGWPPDLIDRLIRSVQEQYPVDLSRIYLTGIGIGAAGSLLAGISYPDRFAAIVPLAGIDPDSLLDLALNRQSGPLNKSLYCRLGDTPVWQIQGALDPISPPDMVAEIQQALQDCAVPSWLQLKRYSEHDVWTQFYNQPAFYRWLLKQQSPSSWQPYQPDPHQIRLLLGRYRQGQEYLTLDWQAPYLRVRLNSLAQPLLFLPVGPGLFASSVGVLEVVEQPIAGLRLGRSGLYLPD